MKINIEFGIRETAVVQKIAGKFFPQVNAEKDASTEGTYGSVSQTVSDGMLALHYDLDARVIPGLYVVFEKHEAEVSAVMMMAKGLFTTMQLAITGIVNDIKGFVDEFEGVRKEEMAAVKDGEPDVEEAPAMRYSAK